MTFRLFVLFSLYNSLSLLRTIILDIRLDYFEDEVPTFHTDSPPTFLNPAVTSVLVRPRASISLLFPVPIRSEAS